MNDTQDTYRSPYCLDCGDLLISSIDNDPNGESNSSCVRCRAEQDHDFDEEPDVVFDRNGEMIESKNQISEFACGMITAGSIVWKYGDTQSAYEVFGAIGADKYSIFDIDESCQEAVIAYVKHLKSKEEFWKDVENRRSEIKKNRRGDDHGSEVAKKAQQ